MIQFEHYLQQWLVYLKKNLQVIFSYTVNLEDVFQPQSADLALKATVWFNLSWTHLNTI